MNNYDINSNSSSRNGMNGGGSQKCDGAHCRAKICSGTCGKRASANWGQEPARTSGRFLYLSGFLFLFGASTAFACPATTGSTPSAHYGNAFTIEAAGSTSDVNPDYYQSSDNPLRGD
jgi:hypothetical protein